MLTYKKKRGEYRLILGEVLNKPYTLEQFKQIVDWCRETYGPAGKDTTRRWRFGWVDGSYKSRGPHKYDFFYFKKEEDMLHFLLIWQ